MIWKLLKNRQIRHQYHCRMYLVYNRIIYCFGTCIRKWLWVFLKKNHCTVSSSIYVYEIFETIYDISRTSVKIHGHILQWRKTKSIRKVLNNNKSHGIAIKKLWTQEHHVVQGSGFRNLLIHWQINFFHIIFFYIKINYLWMISHFRTPP